MRIVLAILALLSCGAAWADDAALRATVRESAWTVEVRNPDGETVCRGSCTLIVDGKGRTWALGCQHVIAEADKKPGWQVVVYRPEVEAGERVGRREFNVEVASASKEEDLALMRVKKSKIGPGATVAGDPSPLPLDARLWHCGTFHGVYDQSVSSGALVGHGYKFRSEGKVCDQGDFPIYGGSSGGGVFNQRGELVGVVVWMHGSNCSFFVPLRRVQAWLKSEGAEFLYNPKAAVPETLPPPKEKKDVPKPEPGRPAAGASAPGGEALDDPPPGRGGEAPVWTPGHGRGRGNRPPPRP